MCVYLADQNDLREDGSTAHWDFNITDADAIVFIYDRLMEARMMTSWEGFVYAQFVVNDIADRFMDAIIHAQQL